MLTLIEKLVSFVISFLSLDKCQFVQYVNIIILIDEKAKVREIIYSLNKEFFKWNVFTQKDRIYKMFGSAGTFVLSPCLIFGKIRCFSAPAQFLSSA